MPFAVVWLEVRHLDDFADVFGGWFSVATHLL
jgi:hypothetical protein